MWRRFLLRCTLLALPLPVMVVLYCLPQARFFPAPRITANVAVNEKAAFARQHFATGADVLALGSSMALNNLSSKAVMEHFGEVRYLNAGAWGIGASELAVIGPILADRLRPSTAVVCTNTMDFAEQPNILAGDGPSIRRSFNESPLMGYLRHWDAPYYLREMEVNRVRFRDSANYEYLGFDPHGGATLSLLPGQISQARFNKPPPPAGALSQERYHAFSEFAQAMHHRGIRLIVITSPYRDGMRNPTNDAVRKDFTDRLRGILAPVGGVLVDAGQRDWPDSLFVDSSHLGAEGSRLFTAYCLAQLGPTR